MLTVPLVGGRENKELFRDVRIDNSGRWQVRQWRTITSAYRRSPWFEFYEPGLVGFFETRYELLYQWNLDLFRWTMKVLKADPGITLLEEPREGLRSHELVAGMRSSDFQDAVYTRGLPSYSQVFQDRIGFQPNMSIMDLVFNEGNNSGALLGNAFE